MKLSEELGFKTDFEDLFHEAILNIYHTAAIARKRSTDFFAAHGITDVQFNLLMLLRYQSDADGAMKQVELSRMMLVNRASVTAIIDRMERMGFLTRAAVPGDRRSKYVRLTPKSLKLLGAVERRYLAEIAAVMGVLTKAELKKLIAMLERIRERMR